MQNLNPFSLPLNDVTVIEASAGTGKTHTIASLYLRLLLQVGENNFSRHLSVQEILVVTFTRMATEELKERIRTRIHQAKQALEDVQATGNLDLYKEDNFLHELIQLVIEKSNLDLAITRLSIAEQDFDLSAIFTIHGFCQRILKRFAFSSGLPFNLEFQEEGESKALQLQIIQDVWRKYFYPQNIVISKIVDDLFKSPAEILNKLKSYIGKKTPLSPENEKLIQADLTNWMSAISHAYKKIENIVEDFKEQWRIHGDKFTAEIYANSEKLKDFTRLFDSKLKQIPDWALSNECFDAKDDLFKYLNSKALVDKIKKGKSINPLPKVCSVQDQFEQEYLDAKNELNTLKNQGWFYLLREINIQWQAYKSTHLAKDFNDLLDLMESSLRGENSQDLTDLIRATYPFAMIDEFQDTDSQQYFIFNQVYLNSTNGTNPLGFLMIGDPKQSIYKFRGADIFSYLKAIEKVNAKFTLNTNYRSSRGLISAVNNLFGSFGYDAIEFNPVKSSGKVGDFRLNNEIAPPIQIYTTENSKDLNFAECCANSIQQWLWQSKQGKAQIGDEDKWQNLEPKDIGILVTNKSQADLVKQALAKRGIKSVYLSEHKSIFSQSIALELLFILQACLNPNNESKILNAIATKTFNWSLAEISHIKTDERRWEQLVQRFVDYQNLWFKSGILAMLHKLLGEEDLLNRSFKSINGERNLTDYLHLAEILQKRSQLEENNYALVRWYESKLVDANGNNEENSEVLELQPRLESDRDLVKIITIHKSKGLAYDLVWLPFLHKIGVKNKTQSKDQSKWYYDKHTQQVLWDLNNEHQLEIDQEEKAENMRLLYVALTRAKYHMAMCLPDKLSNESALLRALVQHNSDDSSKLQADSTSDSVEILSELQQWQERSPNNIQINYATELTMVPQLLTNTIQADNLSYSKFNGKVEQNWRIGSFTYLKRSHDYGQSLSQELAESLAGLQSFNKESHEQSYFANDFGENFSLNSESLNNAENQRIFSFPAGAKVGVALHNFLENMDFQKKLSVNNPEDVTQLTNLALKINLLSQKEEASEIQENAISLLAKWFQQIVNTPILSPLVANSQFKLKDLSPQYRLNELDFLIPIKDDFAVDKFNQLLAKYHSIPSKPLNINAFKGMMQGFIDLVFCHDGKYYLLDYKSNLLGDSWQDYRADKLNNVVMAENYDWQYLIYTVALHRYLKNKLTDYDYELHFGGVIYAFLRGMNGEDANGVFADRPKAELILGLEELFNA